MLKLIINADDFGLNEKVNEAILKSFTNGILQSTSLMANGKSVEQAVGIIRSYPNLDIGIHLTLVGAQPILEIEKLPSLVDEDGNFPKHAIDFTKKYFAEKLSFEEIKNELIAQIEKILDYGIKVSHIDSHQHLHILPKILEITVELANRYNIKFIRFPREKFSAYMFRDLGSVERIIQMLALNHFCSKVEKRISPKTDYFAGFYFGGKLSKENILILINNLPEEGVCELMCHPGLDNYFDKFKSNQYRQIEETQMLIDPEVAMAIRNKNVEITSFRTL